MPNLGLKTRCAGMCTTLCLLHVRSALFATMQRYLHGQRVRFVVFGVFNPVHVLVITRASLLMLQETPSSH